MSAKEEKNKEELIKGFCKKGAAGILTAIKILKDHLYEEGLDFVKVQTEVDAVLVAALVSHCDDACIKSNIDIKSFSNEMADNYMRYITQEFHKCLAVFRGEVE